MSLKNKKDYNILITQDKDLYDAVNLGFYPFLTPPRVSSRFNKLLDKLNFGGDQLKEVTCPLTWVSGLEI